ncbi:MAG TPA: MFS transporter [Usitatibacter sp.]|nr:MFS transporter [Usitatibacter sp.]
MSPQEGLRQRRILYAAAFLRALGVGLMAVLIGLYAARLGMSATQIGVILSSALWGAALAALLTLWLGPRASQRGMLIALSALPVAGCALMLATDSFTLIAAAAFVGMFNVNGRDRGAIPIIEQAIFPATTTDLDRTRVFAWYNVLLDAGYATGGVLAALPTLLEHSAGLDALGSMRASLAVFALLYAAAAVLYGRVPSRIEGAAPVALTHLSPASRPIVTKISALFLLDAFGGGFVGSAILAYFFAERFALPAAEVAILFAAGRVLSACSHLVAAWLSRRIGLVNTMIYTHVPSSLLLFTIVASDQFAVAAFLFLLREGLNEMDVPTRQSYVMAVVRPEERLAAAGITSLVRSGGWAAAPVLAGLLMQAGGLGVPLVVAAFTKLSYDVFLWREFRRVKPPEEAAAT